MKKILILLLIVVLPFLISCEMTPEQKMVMALYRLERTSYTMEGTYLYEYTIEPISGFQYHFSENADAYFEVDKDEIYSEVKMKKDTFYTYVKKNRKNIDEYTKKNYDSYIYKSHDADKFKAKSNHFLFDVRQTEMITYYPDSNIYKCNLTQLTRYLEEYKDELIETEENEMTIKSIFATDYLLKMDEENVSYCSIQMTVIAKHPDLEPDVKIKITMKMNIKEIGQTKVTVPISNK